MSECEHDLRAIPECPCCKANGFSLCLRCNVMFSSRVVLEPVGATPPIHSVAPPMQTSQPSYTVDPRPDLRRLEQAHKPPEPVEPFVFDNKWRRVD